MIYKTDRWTRYQWGRFLELDGQASRAVRTAAERIYSAPQFAREVFARLFHGDGSLVEERRPEDLWAARAHEELEALPDFDRLRRRCQGDRFLAGETAVTVTQEVLRGLPDPPPTKDPNALREELRALLRLQQGAPKSNDSSLSSDRGSGSDHFAGEIDRLRMEGQSAVEALVSFASSVDDSELRRGLRSACKEGHRLVDELGEQQDAFCGWGSGRSAGFGIASPEVKAALAERLRNDDKLKELAREAGRLRRAALAKQRSKTVRDAVEVTDIERGADLERLLPSELMKIADPATFDLFARGYLERSLLQYKLRGNQALVRGPVVICVDQSSSMEGAKEVWSKAVALALLQIATFQKRRCRVIHFNDKVVGVDDWIPGRIDPIALLDSMSVFHGGGTDFEPPLLRALDAIQGDPDLRKADVVIVTDGDAAVSDSAASQWTEARRRFEFTCYAVNVDCTGGIAPAVLDTVADCVIGLADIRADQAATDVLFSI